MTKYELSNMSFEELFTFEHLFTAGKDSCKNVRWKSSTILFEAHLTKEITKALTELTNGTFKFKGFHSFALIEHGKRRDIDALCIQDRAIQKCLCKFYLTPLLSRSFVYGNSASLENKGMDFSLQRIKEQLKHHFNKYGLKGGIYQFDFKSYFASLDHQILKNTLRKLIKDNKIYALCCQFIDDFTKMKTADHSGDPKGIGLGSEISQILALLYANPIDHYITDVLKIKGYGRYMDDGYIICDDIHRLYKIKKDLYKLAEKLKLKMNDKKNKITPFKSHSFTFLKIRFNITNTGKIVSKLSRESIRAIHRKLKKFRNWLDTGYKKISAEDIFASYQSWRAHAKRCNSYRTLCSTDSFFVKLFENELRVRKNQFPCTLKAIKMAEGWKYFIKE